MLTYTKVWVDPETASKIEILRGDFLPRMREFISDDNIPVELGGSMAFDAFSGGFRDTDESGCSDRQVAQKYSAAGGGGRGSLEGLKTPGGSSSTGVAGNGGDDTPASLDDDADCDDSSNANSAAAWEPELD
jgi:hypothetical protein